MAGNLILVAAFSMIYCPAWVMAPRPRLAWWRTIASDLKVDALRHRQDLAGVHDRRVFDPAWRPVLAHV